jgi:hypothetical protein
MSVAWSGGGGGCTSVAELKTQGRQPLGATAGDGPPDCPTTEAVDAIRPRSAANAARTCLLRCALTGWSAAATWPASRRFCWIMTLSRAKSPQRRGQLTPLFSALSDSQVRCRERQLEPCLTDAAHWAAPGSVVVGYRYAEARTSAAALSAACWSGGITAHLLSGLVVTHRSAPTSATFCRSLNPVNRI